MLGGANYNLIIERHGIIRDLSKQIGIIHSMQSGHIKRAELLSGKDQVQRDPIFLELYQ